MLIGCDGNENNFLTLKECEQMCTGKYEGIVHEQKGILANGKATDASGCIYSDWSNWSECYKGELCKDNYQTRELKVIGNHGRKNCTDIVKKRTCFLENCF